MAPHSKPQATPTRSSSIAWRPTKIMNMRDLSKDDDFLSHLLVEKLGTGAVPLLVHKMDATRRLPKTDSATLLRIVQRLVASRLPVQHATKQAVDELLALGPIRYYLKSFTQKQINAFATHASRYLELYHPSGSIEISHTSRYSHRTGKSELCILATRPMAPGTVITELKGSMANLTTEEDMELKRTDLRHSDIRRDFSVIHSKQMKKNHLFLGPARFVNHDCDNNCELFREGKYITFRVIRLINIGEEITAHYGDGYFGRKNRHCLCETCESLGRGGYSPENREDDAETGSEPDANLSDEDLEGSDAGNNADQPASPLNLNERRTRRGVYAIVQEEDDESEESEDEEGNMPLADALDVPADGDIELGTLECDGPLSRSSPDILDVSTPAEGRAIAPVLGLDTPPPSEDTEEEQEVTAAAGAGVTGSRDVHPDNVDANHKRGTKRRRSPSPDPTPLRRVTRSLSARMPAQDEEQEEPPRASRSRSNGKQREETVVDRSLPSCLRREVQHLATPPLSEDTASLPDSASSASTQPVRRGTSLHATNGPGLGRAKTVSRMPSVVNKQSQEDEPEARTLRTRLLTAAATQSDLSQRPAKPAIPRGQDGKPLPICSTCSNILPVISVDSKVIWGLDLTPTKARKRKEKRECPRCMRHFAIYGLPWPVRLPSGRPALIHTPREGSTVADASAGRFNQKTLPALDRKLAAAAAAQSASAPVRRRAVSEEARPTKRRKAVDVASAPAPPVSRVEMSSKAKQLLAGRTRSGRTSLPSAKAQEAHHKRKRGRPRLTAVAVSSPSSSPRRQVFAAEKPMKLKSLAVQSQPRDSNGRFGKKDAEGEEDGEGLSGREDEEEGWRWRGGNGRYVNGQEEEEESCLGEPRKQEEESDGEDIFRFHKKTRQGFVNAAGRPSGVAPPRLRSVSDGMGFGFKGMGLSFMPSPANFARRKWALHVSSDSKDSTRDERAAHDDKSMLISPKRSSDESDRALRASNTSFSPQRGPTLAFTFKPSPASFAQRRWGKTVSSDPTRRQTSWSYPQSQEVIAPSLGSEPPQSAPAVPRTLADGSAPDLVSAVEAKQDAASEHAVEYLSLNPIDTSWSSVDEIPTRQRHRWQVRTRYPPVPLKTTLNNSLSTSTLTLHEPFRAGISGPTPNWRNAGWDTASVSDASIET